MHKVGDVITDFCSHCEKDRQVQIIFVDTKEYYVAYLCTECRMETEHPFSEDKEIDETLKESE